jgi:hypothetical protein
MNKFDLMFVDHSVITDGQILTEPKVVFTGSNPRIPTVQFRVGVPVIGADGRPEREPDPMNAGQTRDVLQPILATTSDRAEMAAILSRKMKRGDLVSCKGTYSAQPFEGRNHDDQVSFRLDNAVVSEHVGTDTDQAISGAAYTAAPSTSGAEATVGTGAESEPF